MRQIYSLIISLYGLSLRLLSVFNQKARDWFYGRSSLFTKLDEVFRAHYAGENPSPVIWIHCASLGEYEQGRPVIQEIKKRFPGFLVLLTFFSPSGFKNRASNSDADLVFYLPIDTRKNARKFIRIVSPSMAVFVKYEFWYNYLHELFINNIPTYTISAIFRPDQHFFKWYGGWFRTHLRHLKRIFVQDEESAELLNMIDVNNVTVCGDTRFDRVTGIMQQQISIPALEDFADGNKVLVAGSTWPADEDLLKKLLDSTSGKLKLIIAPHEVNPHHLAELSNRFKGDAVLFSKLEGTGTLEDITENSITEAPGILRNNKAEIAIPAPKDKASDYRVVIIDSIGLLSQIYKYADIAYIGGGFGVGIHNTLEAAVYSKPILFGPNYHKFREARELIDLEAAVSIKNSEELIIEVNSMLDSSSKMESYSLAAGQYVNDRTGATELIMTEVEGYISNVISK